MTISEPMTLVTDYLLAILTGVLAYFLWRRSGEAGRSDTRAWLYWWAAAYAATAVGGIAGGTVHGFQHALASQVVAGIWMVTLQSLVFAGFAVTCAIISVTRLSGALARVIAALAFGVYGVWVVAHPVFLSALIAYSAALVALAVFALRDPMSASGRLLLGGIAVSVVAAGVQRSRISLHPHFNHNDLFHVVQALAVWLLYRGAIAHR
jgi:hypothetical protein